MPISPSVKKTCDDILEYRRRNNGREPCHSRHDPFENRLGDAKSVLKRSCKKAVGPYPCQRQLTPEEADYFNWCLSAEAIEPGTAFGDCTDEATQTMNVAPLTPMDESVAGMASGGCGASDPANDGAAGASATEGAALSDLLNVFTPVRRRSTPQSLGPYHTTSPIICDADGRCDAWALERGPSRAVKGACEWEG